MTPRTVATQPFQSGAVSRSSFALAVAFGSVTTGVAPAPFVSGEPQAASIIARAMAPSIVESFMTFESGSVGAAWVGCYSHKVELRC